VQLDFQKLMVFFVAESNRFSDEWDELARRCFNFGPNIERCHQIENNSKHKPLKSKGMGPNSCLAITDGKIRSRKQK